MSLSTYKHKNLQYQVHSLVWIHLSMTDAACSPADTSRDEKSTLRKSYNTMDVVTS